jgi:hypothetical protein
MAYPEQLPVGSLAVGGLTTRGIDRADAQCLPQLAQRAQHRGFGKLAAQRFPGLRGGEHAFFVQRLPQLQHQGRNLVAGRFLRRMLPVRVAAQRQHERQRFCMSQEIRLFTHRAEQIQRHHFAGCD